MERYLLEKGWGNVEDKKRRGLTGFKSPNKTSLLVSVCRFREGCVPLVYTTLIVTVNFPLF